jgi:hypothetical protein
MGCIVSKQAINCVLIFAIVVDLGASTDADHVQAFPRAMPVVWRARADVDARTLSVGWAICAPEVAISASGSFHLFSSWVGNVSELVFLVNLGHRCHLMASPRPCRVLCGVCGAQEAQKNDLCHRNSMGAPAVSYAQQSLVINTQIT